MKVFIFRDGEPPEKEIEVAKEIGADIALSIKGGGILTSLFALTDEARMVLTKVRFKLGSKEIYESTFVSLFNLAETRKFLEKKFKVEYIS